MLYEVITLNFIALVISCQHPYRLRFHAQVDVLRNQGNLLAFMIKHYILGNSQNPMIGGILGERLPDLGRKYLAGFDAKMPQAFTQRNACIE